MKSVNVQEPSGKEEQWAGGRGWGWGGLLLCCRAPIGRPFLQTPVPPVPLLRATELQFISDSAALGNISPPHHLLRLSLSLSLFPSSCTPSSSASKRRSRTWTTSTWGADRSWNKLRTSSPESSSSSESADTVQLTEETVKCKDYNMSLNNILLNQ